MKYMWFINLEQRITETYGQINLTIWVIFKKMKTLCDIEGEISNWTN